MPTLADSFAHIFNYKSHMATVHVHNGKSHVHLEYIEAAKKNAQGEIPYSGSSKKTDQSNEHIIFAGTGDLKMPLLSAKLLNLSIQSLPSIFLHGYFRPPISIAA
ncbi:MAG: hypothetical protein ABIN94_04825 [Ferruginibacter sp.]